MLILLLAFLQLAITDANDILELRKLLGADFQTAMQLIDSKNQFLIQNAARMSPRQAEALRAQTVPPSELAPSATIVPLTIFNEGRGLVTLLFEQDFITEQVNLVFCPARPVIAGEPARPRRIVAVQVLFDERSAIRETPYIFERVYRMPQPVVFETYHPAFKYDLAGIVYDAETRWTRRPNAPPLLVWDLGDAEAVYQPVTGERLITAQLWLGHKETAKVC